MWDSYAGAGEAQSKVHVIVDGPVGDDVDELEQVLVQDESLSEDEGHCSNCKGFNLAGLELADFSGFLLSCGAALFSDCFGISGVKHATGEPVVQGVDGIQRFDIVHTPSSPVQVGGRCLEPCEDILGRWSIFVFDFEGFSVAGEGVQTEGEDKQEGEVQSRAGALPPGSGGCRCSCSIGVPTGKNPERVVQMVDRATSPVRFVPVLPMYQSTPRKGWQDRGILSPIMSQRGKPK